MSKSTSRKVTASPVRQAVERGARVLTIHYGDEEWLKRIQEKDLDLGDGEYCVLGQLEGSFIRGTERLGAGVRAEPNYFGFDQGEERSYGLLTRVWRNFIRRRKRQLGWA